MNVVSAFSPGKVLISGEHSVVYGFTGLAASIDTGISVSISNSNHFKKLSDQEDTMGIINKACSLLGGNSEVTIRVESTIISGLGSSAALAHASILALAKFYDIKLSKLKLFDYVMECEKLAHGNPSGIDPAAFTVSIGSPIE